MSELYENIYRNRPPVIDGLLYPGAYIFAGAPKVGKSFLMAQLAYHISTGQPLWNYTVNQSSVLYLALEDDYHRLQTRLYRMFDTDSTDKLHFAICAKQIGTGLNEQLQRFVREHSDTKLIIIDTLQKIRDNIIENYSYASDYEIICQLKNFADQNNICLLLVHHTRKQKAGDKFDMISGTNGLLGAADGAFLLRKEKRTDNTATLEVSGRDQQDQKMYLSRDMDRLTWQLEKVETELWKAPPEPVLQAIANLINWDNPKWCGTATELIEVLHLDLKPNTLTMRLNINAGRLLDEYQINYENTRKHSGRQIKLALVNSKT